MKKIKSLKDPAKLGELSKEQLVYLIEVTEQKIEDLNSQRVVARDELLSKLEGDGEVIGGKAIGKSEYYNFDIQLEEARELGATKIIPAKEMIDTAKLKALVIKGVKIKHIVTERLTIREIKKC